MNVPEEKPSFFFFKQIHLFFPVSLQTDGGSALLLACSWRNLTSADWTDRGETDVIVATQRRCCPYFPGWDLRHGCEASCPHIPLSSGGAFDGPAWMFWNFVY